MYVAKNDSGHWVPISEKKYLEAKLCVKCKLWIPDTDIVKRDGAVFSAWATWDVRRKVPMNTCEKCHLSLMGQNEFHF